MTWYIFFVDFPESAAREGGSSTVGIDVTDYFVIFRIINVI